MRISRYTHCILSAEQLTSSSLVNITSCIFGWFMLWTYSGEIYIAILEIWLADCLLLFHFQLGKTKVFLRAGQIGILDSQRAEVLDVAAKHIQARLKTFIARREFTVNRNSAISLQAYCRGFYFFLLLNIKW